MNYIKKLQLDNRRAAAELKALEDGMTALRVYLSSPKFHEDTTVQVSDIFLRLDEMKSASFFE